MDAFVASSGSVRLPARTTGIPAAAQIFAVAAPIPVPPPVMTIGLPSSCTRLGMSGLQHAGLVCALNWEGRSDLEGGCQFVAGVVRLDDAIYPATGRAVANVLLGVV